MKIRAYPEMYLSDAQSRLASLFDYALNDCDYDPDRFSKYFLISGIGKQFSNGNPRYISGKSGIETAIDIINLVSDRKNFVEPISNFNRTKEYWAGWILAYYQWKTSKSFDEIFNRLPLSKIIDLYNPYHEADISKFVKDINDKYFFNETNLRRIRKRNGITQQKLAELSQTSLRSIEVYEQKHNDINKAQAETLFNIAKTLHCEIKDLLN